MSVRVGERMAGKGRTFQMWSQDVILLKGNFTADELETLVWLMRNRPYDPAGENDEHGFKVVP